MEYTLKCICGETDTRPSIEEARTQALAHLGSGIYRDGEAHTVTCTRPAHGHPDGLPVIVFIANPEKRPVMMSYTADMERYTLPVKKESYRGRL